MKNKAEIREKLMKGNSYENARIDVETEKGYPEVRGGGLSMAYPFDPDYRDFPSEGVLQEQEDKEIRKCKYEKELPNNSGTMCTLEHDNCIGNDICECFEQDEEVA